MVDPPEEGKAGPRPLLERLREAPKKLLKFLSEAPVACVSNALAYVKSFMPNMQLGIFRKGWRQTARTSNSKSTCERPSLWQNKLYTVYSRIRV
jgi:hypothetical protein